MCESLRERIHNSFLDDGLTFCVIELILCIVRGGGDDDDDMRAMYWSPHSRLSLEVIHDHQQSVHFRQTDTLQLKCACSMTNLPNTMFTG